MSSINPIGRKFKAGFTLVELLVVIGIISLLIAILLPALNAARESAKSIACASNMRSIGQAIAMYVQNTKGVLPFSYWDGTLPTDPSYDPNTATDWCNLLANTMDSRKSTLSSGDRTTTIRQIFRCPSAPLADPTDLAVLSTYSAHPRLMPNLDRPDRLRNGMTGTTSNYLKPYRIARIRRSTEITLMFEGAVTINGQSSSAGGSPGRWSAAADAYGMDGSSISLPYVGSTGNNGSWLTDNYALGSAAPFFVPGSFISLYLAVQPAVNTDSYDAFGNLRFRHNKDQTMNALFVDGHVDSFGIGKDKVRSSLKRRNVNVNLD